MLEQISCSILSFCSEVTLTHCISQINRFLHININVDKAKERMKENLSRDWNEKSECLAVKKIEILCLQKLTVAMIVCRLFLLEIETKERQIFQSSSSLLQTQSRSPISLKIYTFACCGKRDRATQNCKKHLA